MNMKNHSVLLYVYLCLVIIHHSLHGVHCNRPIFNVLDYGAVGNGRSDDTNSFQKTWEETCAAYSSVVLMQIPQGKTFLLQPITFSGPCNSRSVVIQINGNLVSPKNPAEWNKCNGDVCGEWINILGVNSLNVIGHGTIDGRGKIWWTDDQEVKPVALHIASSKNVFLGGGLKIVNGPQIQIFLDGLTTAHVSDISIHAPENSPNTDGIHIARCTNTLIDHAWIGTGDDCVSIVDGSSHVSVSNIICEHTHGVSIGSLGRNGADDKVEYIRVNDVVFIGGINGARIKTWQGGRGYARNIVFERILYHGTGNPIIIDQFYCDHEHCELSESAVQVSNVIFREVLGTSSDENAVTLRCSNSIPCRGIVLENIHIRTVNDEEPSYECHNVFGIARGDMVPYLSCLS